VKPLAEHQTVLQVIREMVEEALLRASPALAIVTSVDQYGSVTVRLLDEEASRPLKQQRNTALRLRVNDTVLVVRTLSDDLVVVCPIGPGLYPPDSNRIGPEHLIDGAVISTKIFPSAVTSAAIGVGAVTADKIAAGAVTADKIQTGAVVAGKIGAGAVGNAQIAGGAVTADKIASGVIPAQQIIPTQLPPTDNSVSTVKIQNQAVTSDKIADQAVGVSQTQQKNGVSIFASAGHAHDADYAKKDHSHASYQGYKDIRNATMRISGTFGDLSLEAALQRLFRKAFSDNTITISGV